MHIRILKESDADAYQKHRFIKAMFTACLSHELREEREWGDTLKKRISIAKETKGLEKQINLTVVFGNPIAKKRYKGTFSKAFI